MVTADSRAETGGGGAGSAAEPRVWAALPPLPRFPAVERYGEVAATLERLALRHVGDLLAPPLSALATRSDATGRPLFYVLDGLWFPGGTLGTRMTTVDRAFLAEARKRWLVPGPDSAAAADLVDRLDAVLTADPMGLRRILLYQLEICLRGHPQGLTAEAATRLGVHPDEAPTLIAAILGTRGFSPAARQAAEGLADAWHAKHLRLAADLAGRIPAGHGDPVLEHLVRHVQDLAGEVARALAAGRRLVRAGSADRAAAAFLFAAGNALDDPRPVQGLLLAAVAQADAAGGGGPVRVVVHGDGADVSCDPVDSKRDPSGTEVRYRILRISVSEQEGPDLTAEQIADDLAAPVFVDSAAPIGQALRYAVLPVREQRICGTARASGVVLIAPEATQVASRAIPQGVTASWLTPGAAVAVRTTRTCSGPAAAAHPALEIPCGANGFTDTDLVPGDYRYLVQCGYPGGDGRPVWSAGHRFDMAVSRWPTPVPRVEVEPVDESAPEVRISWAAPDRGTERLVPWPFLPRRPGEDVSDLLDRLPEPIGPGSGGSAQFLVPVGETSRFMAVSVLGNLAVAGPTVLVQVPGAVTDLDVRRVGRTTAEVRFTWPDPAVLVLVGLDQDGRRTQWRHARSAQAGVPVRLTVGPGEFRITVEPLGRPDADLVFAGPASVLLPALPAPRPTQWDEHRPEQPEYRLRPQGPPRPAPAEPEPPRLHWWNPRRWLGRRRRP